MKPSSLALALFTLLFAFNAQANPARDTILAEFAAEAKATNPAFAGFDAAKGGAFFTKNHSSGKPETPACTSCHGSTPFATGQTRAGKPIEPMAVSKNAARYTEKKKVDKWFRRNCKSVLGRECSPQEKGDYLAFMISQ